MVGPAGKTRKYAGQAAHALQHGTRGIVAVLQIVEPHGLQVRPWRGLRQAAQQVGSARRPLAARFVQPVLKHAGRRATDAHINTRQQRRGEVGVVGTAVAPHIALHRLSQAQARLGFIDEVAAL